MNTVTAGYVDALAGLIGFVGLGLAGYGLYSHFFGGSSTCGVMRRMRTVASASHRRTHRRRLRIGARNGRLRCLSAIGMLFGGFLGPFCVGVGVGLAFFVVLPTAHSLVSVVERTPEFGDRARKFVRVLVGGPDVL